MKALSIRQPWAWLVVNAGKDVENRDWVTMMRGRVLVHAGKGMTAAEYDAAAGFLEERGLPCMPPDLKGLLERGGIVGSVEIAGCVIESGSRWFVGKYGFVLRDARTLPFTATKGALGFFEVPDAPRRSSHG